MKKTVVILLITTLFAACEKRAEISYSVKNSCSSPIKVVFTNTKGNSQDKTISIAADNETSLVINAQGLSRVSTYKEMDEYLRNFSKIDVYKNDTLKSKTDFLKTASWTYKEKDKHRADYLLTVTDADF